MKKILLIAILQINIASFCNSQTNLITNGGFESGTWYSNWESVNANGNLWGGPGSNCSPYAGTKYCWCGDQYQNTGVNDLIEDIYQTVTIPYNTTTCTLYFYASVNTLETGSTAYDYLNLNIRSTNGALLYSLGYIDNTNGNNGIPGCQTWQSYYATIPSTYFGQTVRISLEFTSDFSNPTIIRVDDVRLIATISSSCTYVLSNNSYTCPSNNPASYSNISIMNTQSGCSWSANVTSGNSWLSSTSSGNGSGGISINVSQNTTGSSRVGTIDVAGQTLTIIQPGTVPCIYSLSSNNFVCPDGEQNTYSNVVLMNTQSGCYWSANVTSGSNWLATSSSGTGSGAISFIVLSNMTGSTRYGIIDIAGQTLTITQPSSLGISEKNDNKYSIYPIPANEFISIESRDVFIQNSEIEFFDMQGKILIKQVLKNTLTRIDISKFERGIYYLTIKNSNYISTKKIIKE